MRRLSVFAALLATLTLGIGAASAPAQNPNVPASFFGVIPIQLMQFGEFQKMRDAEIGTLRIPVIWPQIEPKKDDVYDWSRIDYEMFNSALTGRQVMPFLYGSPKWTVPGCKKAIKCQNVPPLGSQAAVAWEDFVRDFMQRYGINGSFWTDPTDQLDPPYNPITQVQVWNEPSSPTYWKKPSASKYAQLVKVTHDIVASEDPDARVLLAGLFGTPQGDATSKNVMWKYLARFYQTPAISESFDAVALHPYSPDIAGLQFQLNKARAILDKNGDQAKEILVTEIGWSSASKKGRPLIKGKKGQAKLLKSSYGFLLSNRSQYNIGAIIWYAWADADHKIEGCEFCSDSGLFTLKGKPKPSWTELVKITGGIP